MNRGRIYSLISLLIVVATASLVLLGRQFNVVILDPLVPGMATMKPVVAVLIIISAISLILIWYKESTKAKILVNFLATFVFLSGAALLFNYFYPAAFQLNFLLFIDNPEGLTLPVKRVTPNVALSFVLLGIAILILNIRRKNAIAADFVVVLVAIFSFLSIIGFIYNAVELYEDGKNLAMALHTAICLCVLSINVLCYYKDPGFIKEITSRHGGKQVSIVLMPLALVLPGLLGFLGLMARRAGYSFSLSIAIVDVANTLILLFFIWRISLKLNRSNFSLLNEIETRKKVEHELKESNIFFDTVLENVPDRVFVKDAKTFQYLFLNKATENFIGIFNKEAVGKTDFFIFQKDEAELILQNDLDLLQSGELFLVKEQKLIRDGKEYWNTVKKIPIKDKDGTPLYIIGIASDITETKKQQDEVKVFNKELEREVIDRTKELQKSEQRFRTLIESGIDSIKMMDDKGVIFYASNSHERLIGYSPVELLNTEWISYIHPDDLSKAEQGLERVKAEPEVAIMIQLRMRHKLGHYISIEGALTNYLHDENINAIICNFHDVSEKQETEREKRRLENALTNEKINRQKHIAQATIDIEEKERTAIGMELHDNISQILGAIKLYIGMAKSRPEKRQQMLEKSEENLMLCIQEVRKLSKSLVSPNIKMGLAYAITDLVDVVESSTDVHVDFKITGEKLHVIDERAQLSLYRIVQEQLNNIIKHSEAKNVLIAIDFSGNTLDLQIQDDGKGFDLDKQFSGIGLRNMANRIEFLKGTFNIETSKNNGCKILISMPVEQNI